MTRSWPVWLLIGANWLVTANVAAGCGLVIATCVRIYQDPKAHGLEWWSLQVAITGWLTMLVALLSTILNLTAWYVGRRSGLPVIPRAWLWVLAVVSFFGLSAMLWGGLLLNLALGL